MPIIRDGAPVHQETANLTSASWNQTIAADATAYVICGTWRSGSAAPRISTATINGVALTRQASLKNSANTCGVEIWALLSPPTGANLPVSVTYVAAVFEAGVTGISYRGVSAFGSTPFTLQASAGELSTADTSVIICACALDSAQQDMAGFAGVDVLLNRLSDPGPLAQFVAAAPGDIIGSVGPTHGSGSTAVIALMELVAA